jgi:tetratricopeptide (TPR) repeat protein
MNSWHSWSPNSRWLVFSSKANGPYTQLFLTHIDAQGHSTPPVVLDRFTATNRAANIPEFVSLPAGGIARIQAEFLNDYSHARAGFTAELTGDPDGALREYEAALRLNPENAHAHERLGYLLGQVKQDPVKGLAHCREAVRLNPGNGQARFILGLALLRRGDIPGAIEHLTASLKGLSEATDPHYTPLAVHSFLGLALLLNEDFQGSVPHLAEAARLDPTVPDIELHLGLALAQLNRPDEAIEHYRKACRLNPALEASPQFPDLLSQVLARAGRHREATDWGRRALAAAQTAGDEALARQIESRLESYRQRR